MLLLIGYSSTHENSSSCRIDSYFPHAEEKKSRETLLVHMVILTGSRTRNKNYLLERFFMLFLTNRKRVVSRYDNNATSSNASRYGDFRSTIE